MQGRIKYSFSGLVIKEIPASNYFLNYFLGFSWVVIGIRFPLITTIYLQNTTSIVANTFLLLLELLFEVSSLMYTLRRFALIQLWLKQFCNFPRNSEITNRQSDKITISGHERSNLDVTEEIFTLLTINNLNDVETSGLIDFSLILGNIIHTQVTGSLAVSNIWYRGVQTNLFLF